MLRFAAFIRELEELVPLPNEVVRFGIARLVGIGVGSVDDLPGDCDIDMARAISRSSSSFSTDLCD